MKLNLFVLFFLTIILSSCNQNNVTVDDSLKKFFDDNKVKGTFGIYDNANGNFTIYNLSRFKDSAYLPASTFKIVNSLIGLETGKIANEKMVIKWDGIKRFNEAWNADLSMAEAFKLSSVGYYQEVARRIGKGTMQHWLDTLAYGTRYTKPVIKTIDSFWLDNSIKITPDEQVGLAKKLYFDQLPFQKRTMRIVKDAMLMENNANYKLAYKTGWGFDEKGRSVAWIVGWIEENQHVYPFTLNFDGPRNMDVVTVRMNMLKGILKQLGFLEGRK